MKKSIEELTGTISDSKSKVKEATIECKRVEKEMEEFKNNRGSKLAQLKVGCLFNQSFGGTDEFE